MLTLSAESQACSNSDIFDWCPGQAISQGQHLIIPVSRDINDSDDMIDEMENLSLEGNGFVSKSDVADLLLSLPRNLHWDKERQKAQNQEKQQAKNSQERESLGILEEENEDEEKAEEGLEIAWQYRKSVQQERLAMGQPKATASSGATNVFCHSYDLSGRMNEQNPIDPALYMAIMEASKSEYQTRGFALFRELVSLLKGKDGKAVRLLLLHPDLEVLAVALPLFLAHIRKQSMPVVVMVCTPPKANSQAWTNLSRTCDVVLSTEGFASRKEYPPPPEFRHLQGLLTIAKVSTVTAATANGGGHYSDLTISKRPAAYIYGLKRDRRKLHIPLLHIPPEDYAQGGGSVGSGVRSGAGKVAEPKKTSGGMGCASNLSGSALDF